jgi:hypothetical protein
LYRNPSAPSSGSRAKDGRRDASLFEGALPSSPEFTLEASRLTNAGLRPTTADFVAALDEINAFDSKSARNITGFRPN